MSLLLTEIQEALDSYFERTGNDIYLQGVKCVVCGDDLSVVFHPSHGLVALDVDHDGYGNRRDIIGLHRCTEVPTYKCKVCKDTTYILVNMDRTGQDSDIQHQPCPNRAAHMKRKVQHG